MRRLVIVGFVLATLGAACKKHAPTASTGSAGSAEPVQVAPANADAKPAMLKDDPWATMPPGSGSLGAAVGDELARIKGEAQAKGAARGKLATKTDVSMIALAPKDNLPIHSFAGIKHTGFTVSYSPSAVESHEVYRKALEGNHVFEEVAEGLNKTVRLPTTVDIQLVDCETVNAFYDPNNQRIIVCYELLDYFLEVFRGNAKNDSELGSAVIGATIFSFFHESGHALIHLLDLPAVGREEDSADQLATITLIAAGDEGVAMALSGAYWFQLQQKNEHKTAFWDEHAFDGQRFYNILCMIYGSNPSKYQGFVTSGDLPKERAARCTEEFTKISRAWQKLLKPHLTNSGAENMDEAQPAVATTLPPPQPTLPPVAKTDKLPTPKDNPQPTGGDPWGASNTPTHPVTVPAPNNVPSSDPWATPAPATTETGVSCEQVADKAIELIGKELQNRASTLTEEEVDEAKAKIDAELPALYQQFIAECQKENWPTKDRQCILRAASLDAATKCGVK